MLRKPGWCNASYPDSTMTAFKPIIIDSLHFFLINLRQIAAFSLPFLLFGSAVNNLVFNAPDFASQGATRFLPIILSLALKPIYTAALILLMAAQARQERPATRDLLSAAMGHYAPLLMLSVITLALIWTGFMALIIPGIWVLVRLSFAEFYLVLDRIDPKTAIIKSFHMTRGHFAIILASLALFALPIFLFSLLLANLLGDTQVAPLPVMLAETTISFAALFLDVVLFRIFMQAVKERPVQP
jgi:hypothetical protein